MVPKRRGQWITYVRFFKHHEAAMDPFSENLVTTYVATCLTTLRTPGVLGPSNVEAEIMLSSIVVHLLVDCQDGHIMANYVLFFISIFLLTLCNFNDFLRIFQFFYFLVQNKHFTANAQLTLFPFSKPFD